MTTTKARFPEISTAREGTERRLTTESAAVRRSLDHLWERYGQYAVSADEVRVELDRHLGDRRLTAELYRMRGK